MVVTERYIFFIRYTFTCLLCGSRPLSNIFPSKNNIVAAAVGYNNPQQYDDDDDNFHFTKRYEAVPCGWYKHIRPMYLRYFSVST